MRSKAIIFIILALCCGDVGYGQKKKPRPKPPMMVVDRFPFEVINESVSAIKDFAYVVGIDKDSNITVTIQTSEDSTFLANTADTRSLERFFKGVSVEGNKSAEPSFQPIVVIKADISLNCGILTDAIRKIRDSSKLNVKIEVAPGYYAFIPAERKIDPSMPRPNPLTLVVSLDDWSNIMLNRESQGKLGDTRALHDRLKQIFRDREANGVFREGTNQTATTVYVRAARSALFSEVVTLINTIRVAGASPVGLQVDDLK